MDDPLAGQRARCRGRDARGQAMSPTGSSRPQPGATVQLTLDRTIQPIAEQALAEA